MTFQFLNIISTHPIQPSFQFLISIICMTCFWCKISSKIIHCTNIIYFNFPPFSKSSLIFLIHFNCRIKRNIQRISKYKCVIKTQKKLYLICMPRTLFEMNKKKMWKMKVISVLFLSEKIFFSFFFLSMKFFSANHQVSPCGKISNWFLVLFYWNDLGNFEIFNF